MIIKHGLVVDPASGLSEHMDILVKNGKIARIARHSRNPLQCSS